MDINEIKKYDNQIDALIKDSNNKDIDKTIYRILAVCNIMERREVQKEYSRTIKGIISLYLDGEV